MYNCMFEHMLAVTITSFYHGFSTECILVSVYGSVFLIKLKQMAVLSLAHQNLWSDKTYCLNLLVPITNCFLLVQLSWRDNTVSPLQFFSFSSQILVSGPVRGENKKEKVGCNSRLWVACQVVHEEDECHRGSLGAVRAAVLQQEQMSPLNGPSWWPSQSGNPSPFAPN